MAGLVKVGVTSWTERSLIASGWYPRGTGSPEGRLRYYATQFPIVENDSMYYALPPPRQAELWVQRTPAAFTMNVKAPATLTQHYTDPQRLPADVQESLPEELLGKRRVYPKDLGDAVVLEIARRFRAAIDPLRASGKLGVVLLQFPVWFTCSRENERYLLRARDLLEDCRVAVEFRNALWMNERHLERTIGLLRDAGLVYTCVDEPQGFPSSVPPIAAATADVALVRFHGRSDARWNRRTPTAAERFRYRYSQEELAGWVRPIRRLAEQAEVVHVLFNNCYSNYAVTNARQLGELIEEAPEARVARPAASDSAGPPAGIPPAALVRHARRAQGSRRASPSPPEADLTPRRARPRRRPARSAREGAEEAAASPARARRPEGR